MSLVLTLAFKFGHIDEDFRIIETRFLNTSKLSCCLVVDVRVWLMVGLVKDGGGSRKPSRSRGKRLTHIAQYG